MIVGITGAGGQLGGAMVGYALSRTAASKIVAVTRNPEKLEEFSKQGVQVRAGDFNDPAGLKSALAGVERLVIIPTTDLTPGVRIRQHTDAIHAAKSAGVPHVIYISTVSPKPDAENMLLDSHFATEQALIGSGLTWTLLRMSVYMNTLVDGAKKAVASGSYAAIPGAPAAYVTRDDLAAAAAGLLCSAGHAGITYHATGPVSVTQQEIADTIAKIAGKAIAFSATPAESQRAGLEAAKLPSFVVNSVAGFYAALRAGAFDLVTGDVGRLAGKTAESPAEFLGRALREV
jgi:NAD(P)H dehydrogenase (quinone)